MRFCQGSLYCLHRFAWPRTRSKENGVDLNSLGWFVKVGGGGGGGGGGVVSVVMV